MEHDQHISTPAAPGSSAGEIDTASPRRQRIRLGDVLVQQRLVSEQQLDQALEQQRSSGKRLGRVLIDNGLITEDSLVQALARQLRIPFVNLKTFPVKGEAVRLLSESHARRHRAIVIDDKGEHLLLAMADPLDLFAYDELCRQLRRPARLAVVAESQLLGTLDRHYRRTEEITGLAKALEKDIGDTLDFGSLQASVGQEGAPVVRLLQTVFEEASQVGASDVHLEPQERELLIRHRVDGVLQTQNHVDKRVAAALTQRLKLMANLDISEKRLPQDGRFSLRLAERTLDVRLSTLPSQHGESVVMRLLGHGDTVRRLEHIGMPAAMLRRLREIIGRTSGMVLVTGPTGSGKTTTLYAALAEIDAEQHKIITVEDPVEYRLPGLTQVQVNDRIELSFAKVLRATLRQDPDVILVGEMRDTETAEIGLRGAMTGHLVLSTLHTRDAVSTPFRLLDMGVPAFMVATSLQAVIAQRLVRVNCPHCLEPHEPTPQQLAWLASLQADATGLRPHRGAGCSACNGTGYSGRVGVYEMLEMDAEMAQTATRGDPTAFLHAARRHMVGRTMAHHALALVREHRTSLAEAMRIAGDLQAATD
ncbi:MSHA biogenesis protein MshE [Sphaerotilus hippei]|uniref:MSHA biogenesis protein MshE n=1 Tax=Sphaerotilus hippei TaxID=744406 RepID=A0A318GZ74_9BURK|nr:GspE/PulE family protein [Sphaerotilus hippei]PXW95567.1 MSHA biogenesis protein MshE [Sphaerotilus hippei]